MTPNTRNNRVEIGRAIVEAPDNPDQKTINVWGQWQLRRREFAAVPGAVKRPHGWGYTIPADTDPALLEQLRASVYADPAPGLAFERVTVEEYGRTPIYAKWTTEAFGAAFEIIAHPDAVLIESKRVTLARVDYYVHLEYNPSDRPGSGGAWTPKLRYSSRADGDYKQDITRAALLEAFAKFGAVLAAFLDAVPEAFGVAQALSDDNKRAELRRQIAKLESELAEARQRLELLG